MAKNLFDIARRLNIWSNFKRPCSRYELLPDLSKPKLMDKKSLFDDILDGNNVGDPDLTHFLLTACEDRLDTPIVKSIVGGYRTRTFAVNLGESAIYSKSKRKMIPTTMLQLRDNIIIGRSYTKETLTNPSFLRLWVTGVLANEEQKRLLPYKVKAVYDGFNVKPRLRIKKVKVDPIHDLPISTKLDATFYKPGQMVRLVSLTQDHGFQGVMKRWGFKGGRATHGVSLTHRKGGAIQGFKKYIYPFFKMPGHMGFKKSSVITNIARINFKHNVLYVTGCGIGYVGGVVDVLDFGKFIGPDLPQELPEEIYDDDYIPFGQS